MTRDEIAEINPDALMCDGLDEAIIGMAERINLGPVVAYDVDKVIEILMKDMEVDKDELEEGETIEGRKYEMAMEHFDFNIKGAWLGEFTPVFITLSRTRVMERQEIFTSLKKLIKEKFSEEVVTPTMYCPEKFERRMSFAILDKVETSTGNGVYKRFTITLEDNTPIKD